MSFDTARRHLLPRGTALTVVLLLASFAAGCGSSMAIGEGVADEVIRPRRARPFASGERLVFRARVAGVDAARATLSVGEEGVTDKGQEFIPLRVTVEGYRWLTRFYPLKIKMITQVDPYTLQPLRMDRSGSNGHLPRTVSLDFRSEGRVLVQVHIEGKRPKKHMRYTTQDAFDTVSGLYDIRAWLMTGEPEREMVVFDGGYSRRVRVTRGKVEEVWTPAGWFKARRFEVEAKRFKPKRDRRRIPKKRRGVSTFTAWVTDDEHLVPVKLLGNTPVGPAEVLLESRHIKGVEPPALSQAPPSPAP